MPYKIDEFISLRNKELSFLRKLLREEKYTELTGIIIALSLKERRYGQLFEVMIEILKRHKFLTNPFTSESGLNEKSGSVKTSD